MDFRELRALYNKLYKVLLDYYDKTLEMSMCINCIKDIISTLDSCRSYNYKQKYALQMYERLCGDDGKFLSAYTMWEDNLDTWVGARKIVDDIASKIRQIMGLEETSE